jgi:hypothetical protein
VANLDAVFDELLGNCTRSAVHLEMRDSYTPDDPAFLAWRAGDHIEPDVLWRPWFELIRGTVARGVRVRRARVISEPVTEYIKFEYDVTAALNIAAGEDVRWLARRRASALALPGNDFWLFDGELVQFNLFSGDGDWLDVARTDDPTTAELCASAFEAVWECATPHADYRPN